ncbi:MAG: hypothetical protein SWK90_11400 [Chloroflexota bacterium]|nr:hypothetical protein [Chloroflexota bacterium]
MQTTTGRELTVTTAFRLPITDYQRAQAMAEAENVRLSTVMRRLVAVGLEVQQRLAVGQEVQR